MPSQHVAPGAGRAREGTSGARRGPWLHSLGSRLTLAFALVALLGVGTVAIVANQVTARQFSLYVSRGKQVQAQRWAELAAQYYGRTGSWEDVETILVGLTSERSPGQGRGRGASGWGQGTAASANDRFLIADPEGRIVFDTAYELTGQAIDPALQEGGVPILVDGQLVGTLWVTTIDASGRSDLDQRFLDAVNQAVLWAVLLVAAASLAAAALLSRQLVAPLRRLTAAAEALAGGDLSQQVKVRAQDEIGELAHAFNQMANDLQAAEAQRQQMTADIAHELRNPLSVIRGNLEAMLDGVYPVDAEHLAPIHEETMLLQRLVEDLRLLSLADAGQLRLVHSDVDVAALLEGVTGGVQAVAGEKGIALRVVLPPTPLVVEGDADRLRQVLGNLVSNALRYTPAGGKVTLAASQDGDRVQIAVSDTGQGISAADLPHVFDRFYRADAARDRASGGSGLGLAIARALIEAHGGTIDVQSAPGQGTTCTVWL